MIRRFALGLILASVVTGCSLIYELRAVEIGGRIAFVPKKKAGTGCLSDFTITSQTGETIWNVSADGYSPPPCDNKFPVVYGRVPRGMKETIKAKPLRLGVRYRISGSDGDSYWGGFRIRRAIVIDSLEPDDIPTEPALKAMEENATD